MGPPKVNPKMRKRRKRRRREKKKWRRRKRRGEEEKAVVAVEGRDVDSWIPSCGPVIQWPGLSRPHM